jgi:hypothetical protein
MLTNLPSHRKNDPLWGKHRVPPTPAFSRFPPKMQLATFNGESWEQFGDIMSGGSHAAKPVGPPNH